MAGLQRHLHAITFHPKVNFTAENIKRVQHFHKMGGRKKIDNFVI
jgi:hypothetical protein